MGRALFFGIAFFFWFVSTPIGKAQDDMPASVFPSVLLWNDATPSVTDLSDWLDEHGEHKEPLPIEFDASGGAVLVIGPRYETLWYEVKAKWDSNCAVARCPPRLYNLSSHS